MQRPCKINGHFIDGEEVIHVSEYKNRSFFILLNNRHKIEFNVPPYTKQVTEKVKRLIGYKTTTKTIPDFEAIEEETINLKDSREAFINQLVNYP